MKSPLGSTILSHVQNDPQTASTQRHSQGSSLGTTSPSARLTAVQRAPVQKLRAVQGRRQAAESYFVSASARGSGDNLSRCAEKTVASQMQKGLVRENAMHLPQNGSNTRFVMYSVLSLAKGHVVTDWKGLFRMADRGCTENGVNKNQTEQFLICYVRL